MEEDKRTADDIEKERWKLIINVVTLVFFVITIALLVYIVILYLPLKEQIVNCNKNYPNITGWVNISIPNHT